MSVNKYYVAALDNLKAKRKAELALFEAKMERAREENPRLKEIEYELSKNGAGLALAALSGSKAKIDEIRAKCEALSKEKQEMLNSIGLAEPAPECPVCKDEGKVSGRFCQCVKFRARALMAQELGSEMPLSSSTFESFSLNFYPDENSDGVNPKKRMTQILKACTEFAKNFGKDSGSMVFLGGAGLGKTHLSLAIVNEVPLKGYEAVYSPAGALFDRLEKEHFAYTGSEDFLDTVLGADLLVIDDLGTEFLNQFVQSAFYNIINTRILRGKATILSTNLSPEEIAERYTPRIFSRLLGHYDFKAFAGSDIRQKKALLK